MGLKNTTGLKRNESEDLESVVSDIENEAVRELNDVLVAEDGYVHDEPLLAGYIDPETGIKHSTFTYREMTGKDEEAINKSDIRTNGAKIVNVLVERCVSEIGTLTRKELGPKKWGEVVRRLFGGDLDYIAFKIREISKGKEVTFEHKCPDCGTKLTTIVSTDEFNIKEFGGATTIPFSLPRGYKDSNNVLHKEGVLRIVNGFDREIIVPLLSKNVSTGTTLLLTRLMSFNDGAVVFQDNVSNMSLRDREYLEGLIKDTTFGVDTVTDIVCTNCGAEISGDVGTSNFF